MGLRFSMDMAVVGLGGRFRVEGLGFGLCGFRLGLRFRVEDSFSCLLFV